MKTKAKTKKPTQRQMQQETAEQYPQTPAFKELTFSNFEDWKKACEEREFEGPIQIQGHKMFEFRIGANHHAWEAGKKAAHWDGTSDYGVIFAETAEGNPMQRKPRKEEDISSDNEYQGADVLKAKKK